MARLVVEIDTDRFITAKNKAVNVIKGIISKIPRIPLQLHITRRSEAQSTASSVCPTLCSGCSNETNCYPPAISSS